MIARPERREQQDAAEAHAAEHAADHLARREPALDRPQRQLGFGAHLAVGLDEVGALLFEERQEQRLGIRIARLRQRADRAEPRRLVGARELHRCLGQRQQRLDLGILLLRERALDHRQHVLVGAALQRLRRGEPRRAVRRDELQRRDCRGELAPDPVVEHDVVARFRQRVDLGAGREIDGRAVLDAKHRLARRLHFAVEQRLQQRQGVRVAGGNERRDGLDLLLVLAEREIVHELRRDRLRGHSARSAGAT